MVVQRAGGGGHLIARFSTRKSQHMKINAKSLLSNVRMFASNQNSVKNLRVAIVGGGASGLSTALQLAPLVESGIISKPIDVYEKSQEYEHKKSLTEYGSGQHGRDIGVGIWSTALQGFKSSRESHQTLLKSLEHMGSYVDKVGYRVPNGKWLTKTKLDINGPTDLNTPDSSPSLLFIQENDFLSSIKNAALIEQEKNGTIKLHSSKDGKANVGEILLTKNENDDGMLDGILKFQNGSISSNSYNMIIGADGMNSNLRKNYAGYESLIEKWKKTSTKVGEGDEALVDLSKWQHDQLEEKHSFENRKYLVFRGNSPLTSEEADIDGYSFQTWGEGKNMRFASVLMSRPKDAQGQGASERIEQQVWFATIADDVNPNVSSMSASERKEFILHHFSNWHGPIKELIETTPEDSILVEKGLAHKHSLQPVLDLSEVLKYKEIIKLDKEKSVTVPSGKGPIFLLKGDAYMTIDPVLAQGFTVAMEGATDLAQTLSSIKKDDQDGYIELESLRKALISFNDRRLDRLMVLIRSTELVQAMAQPGSDFTAMLTKYIIRPFFSVIPSSIKEAAFSTIMRYSVGYYLREK